MADWYLNRALSAFRAEVNAEFPGRDKFSDGTIGDASHQVTDSDHNPDADGSVDAWDMDVEVNGAGRPYAGDVETLKQVFQQHPAARYWIHADQIASRSDGWIRRPYTGASRHLQHVHWNTRDAYEDSTEPWKVRAAFMLTQAEIAAIAKAVADYPVVDFITGRSLPLSQMWQATRADANQTEGVVLTIAAKLDPVDEEAVASRVLAVLTPQAIAAAIPAAQAAELADLLAARLAA